MFKILTKECVNVRSIKKKESVQSANWSKSNWMWRLNVSVGPGMRVRVRRGSLMTSDLKDLTKTKIRKFIVSWQCGCEQDLVLY